jgi:hypothetical protein
MKFELTNPESSQFHEALGIPNERVQELRKIWSGFIKEYRAVRIGSDGEIEERYSAAELVQGFLQPIEDGNLPEIIYASFNAANKFLEIRKATRKDDFPEDMPEVLKMMLKAMGNATEIRVKTIKLKKPKKDAEDDGIPDEDFEN